MIEPLVEELRARDDASYLIADERWRILAAEDRHALTGDGAAETLVGQSAYDVLGAAVIDQLERNDVAALILDDAAYALTSATFALPTGTIRVVRVQEEQATLERVLSLIVHEVRNPLSAMRALAQGLEEAVALDAMARGYVARLTGEIDRLGRLLASMSQVARLRAQPMDLLSPLVALERVAQMFQLEASSRGVTIATHVTPRAGPIRADADLIQQMLVNLVTNAMQAMPQGGALTLRARLDARGRTVMLVEDTGVGMSQERMQATLRPGQSTKPGGMGLGLMVVRSIARGHGAYVRMSSVPGKGSSVSITFPLASGAPEASVADVATAPLTLDRGS